MKQTVMLATALITAGGVAGLGTVALASADSPAPTTGIVHRVHRYRGVRLEARLNQAVRDGTITEAQKKAFLAEVKSLRNEHKADTSKDTTQEERKAEHAQLHQELQAWATANHFPLDKIMPLMTK